MSLYDVAEAQRAALLRGERQAASELVHAYGGIWQRMQALLDDLLRQKAEAEARGLVVDDGWLFRFNRLETLQHQVEAELRVFVEFADPLITRQQWQATGAALDHSQALTQEALARQGAAVSVIWNRLPREALGDLIGFTANGSPLRALLDELGPAASAAVRDTLLQGVTLGWNPKKIAREMRQELGGNLVRALRISRTETLRAYREATFRSYAGNSDVIDGWIWLSAATPRTCAACWALHGTLHKLSERQVDHINGRCTQIPHMRFEEQPVNVTPGSEQFAKLDPDTQDAILGKAAGEAYRDGRVALRDFVGRKQDPDWGPGLYVRSLKDILGAD
jgi:SPP1 gp7 family putative phage head morphogenesis protein